MDPKSTKRPSDSLNPHKDTDEPDDDASSIEDIVSGNPDLENSWEHDLNSRWNRD